MPTQIIDQLNTLTREYFLLQDDMSAWDNFFSDSLFMELFLNQRKGLKSQIDSGSLIAIPIIYKAQKGGAFGRGEVLDSSNVDSTTKARFEIKFYNGNGTILYQDLKQNSGDMGIVSLVQQKVDEAQRIIRQKIWEDLFTAQGDSTKYITGAGSMTSETSATAYAGLTEDEFDVWEGQTNTTGGALTVNLCRSLISSAKVGTGRFGFPDYMFTTQTVFDGLKNVATGLQRFTQQSVADESIAKLGFNNIWVDGTICAADDMIDSGVGFFFNSKYMGMGVLGSVFDIKPWKDLPSVAGQTMKIFFSGNMVCSRRKAQLQATGLTAAT